MEPVNFGTDLVLYEVLKLGQAGFVELTGELFDGSHVQGQKNIDLVVDVVLDAVGWGDLGGGGERLVVVGLGKVDVRFDVALPHQTKFSDGLHAHVRVLANNVGQQDFHVVVERGHLHPQQSRVQHHTALDTPSHIGVAQFLWDNVFFWWRLDVLHSSDFFR